MKFLFALCLGLLPLITLAQTDVARNERLNSATIIEFRPPYKEMVIYLEEEEQQRHSFVTLADTVLFLKKTALTKKKKLIKPDEYFKPEDFRAGMKVNLMIKYFQTKNITIAERIALDESFYGSARVKGIYEKLDGQRATIDGQTVMLELAKGKAIDGQGGWKGMKFTSFNDMQLGAEVEAFGERRTDGVIYASRGYMRPVEMGKEDYLLRKATDQEMRVSKGLLEIANTWKFQFITNNTLEAYVSTVGRRLIPEYLKALPTNHPDHIAFKFYLVDEASFGASSYPNGAVVIHSGLLKNLENEAQLAAIVGHEMAHITQKHYARQYRNHQNWEAVQAFGLIMAAGTGDATPLLVSQFAAELSVSNFSQTQETQADRIGMNYMVSAGYDPREAVAVWKRLSEEDKDERQKGQQTVAMGWIQKSFKGTSGATDGQSVASPNRPVAAPVATSEQPLFPSHPQPRTRYSHVNFLLSTAYADLPLNTMDKGDARFAAMRNFLISPSASSGPKPPKPKPGPKPKPKKV